MRGRDRERQRGGGERERERQRGGGERERQRDRDREEGEKERQRQRGGGERERQIDRDREEGEREKFNRMLQKRNDYFLEKILWQLKNRNEKKQIFQFDTINFYFWDILLWSGLVLTSQFRP